MPDEFDELEAKYRAAQSPDAPHHPDAEDPFAELEGQFRAKAAPAADAEPSGMAEPLPTAQGIAHVLTAPGRLAERAAREGIREVPEKFGMEKSAPGGVLEDVVGTGARMIGDTPAFLAGAALAPEAEGAALLATGAPTKAAAGLARYGNMALTGAYGTAALKALEDMASKGEIHPQDAAIAGAYGALGGIVIQGGVDAVGSMLTSRAGQAVMKATEAAGVRIETELNTMLYRAKKGLGMPQETGLVPKSVAADYVAGKISYADAARQSTDIFNAMLKERGLNAGVDPVADEALLEPARRAMVGSGMHPEAADEHLVDTLGRLKPKPEAPAEVAPAPAAPPAAAPAPIEEPAAPEWDPKITEAVERTGGDPEAISAALANPPSSPGTIEPSAPPESSSTAAPTDPATVPEATADGPFRKAYPYTASLGGKAFEVKGSQDDLLFHDANALGRDPADPAFREERTMFYHDQAHDQMPEVLAARRAGKPNLELEAQMKDTMYKHFVLKHGEAPIESTPDWVIEARKAHEVDGAPASWDEAISTLSQPTPEEIAAAPEMMTERPVYEQTTEEISKRFPGVDEATAKRLQAQAEQGISKLMAGDIEKGPATPAMDLIRRLGGISKEGLANTKTRGEAARLEGRGLIREDGHFRGWDDVAEVLHEAGLIGERDTQAAIDLLEDEARKLGKKPPEPKSLGAAAKAQFAVKKPDLLPEEVVRSLQAAGVKPGSEVALLRAVKDPIFGNLKKGQKVTFLSADAERGQVLLEYDNGLAGRELHVAPLEAIAEPIKNAPAPTTGPAEVKTRVLESTGVQTPEEIAHELTESEALRSKLQAEARGARGAMVEAKKALRQEIKQAIVNGKWEVATRNKIVEFARAFLPPEARGTMLTQVAKAKGPKDLLKAFYDIDQKATLITNKKTMKSIRIIVDRVLNSPTFPVRVKGMIREMISEVRLENWNAATIDRVRAQQELVDQLRAEGQDMTIPQAVLDQISKLGLRPLTDLDSFELDDMLTNLRFMVERGLEMKAVMRNLEELLRLDKLKELVEGTKKIERPSTGKSVRRKFMGPQLDWADRMKNEWLRLADFSQHSGIALRPIQVVVDDLDGTLLGGGANRRVLLEPLQDGYIQHQGEISRAHDFLAKTMQKFGALDAASQDRVTAVLLREQVGGREKAQQLGLTDEEIDAIKLTPAEQGTLDALRGYLNDPAHVNALSRTAAKLYNKEFVHVEKYWPMMTDYAAKEGASAPAAILEQIDMRRKNVERGSLIERKEDAKQKVRTDIYAVFLASAQQSSSIVNMAEPILRAHELITDPKYLEAAGDAGQIFWRDYVDVLARDGKISAARRNWALDFFRKNLGTAALTFKPQTAAIQLSSMGSGATITGGKHMSEALTAGPEWEGFVDEHMPLIRERKGGDPAVREVLEGGILTKVKERGFGPIVKMDHYAARVVGLAAYFQYCELHGITPDPANPIPAGLRYAQTVPGRSMASPWLVDMPLALSRGNVTGNASIDRAVFQFQSETLAKWSLITRQVFGRGKSGDVKGAAEAAGWLGATLIYETGVKAAWRTLVLGSMLAMGAITQKQFDDEINQNDLLWKGLAVNALGAIPFVGSVGNYIAYDSGPIPLVDVMGDVFKGAANLVTGTINERPLKATRGLVQALTATALLAGIPGSGQAGWLIKQPLRGLKDKQPKGTHHRSKR